MSLSFGLVTRRLWVLIAAADRLYMFAASTSLRDACYCYNNRERTRHLRAACDELSAAEARAIERDDGSLAKKIARLHERVANLRSKIQP